jgi:hypothetical protein
MGFLVKLKNLQYERDLLDETSSSNLKCLELQVRIIQLAEEFPGAAGLCINKHETSSATSIF